MATDEPQKQAVSEPEEDQPGLDGTHLEDAQVRDEPTEDNGTEPREDGEGIIPPDLDSEDEVVSRAEPSEDPDDPIGGVERQEKEEQEMMTQTASAAVAEHLRAEQSIGDNTAFLTEGQETNATRSSSRFPSLKPNTAHIARLPSPRGNRGQNTPRLHILTRALPTKMVKMSKISMSARARVSTSHPSNYVLNPRRPQKVVTLDQALSARPPLRLDMEGPTPCSYTPSTKPLSETNSPQWSFGQKTFNEKAGGGRTSWEKTWFQSPHVWLQKADFYQDNRWPNPNQYQSQPAMGPYHPVAKAGVSHSIGIRRTISINKKGSNTEPAPNEYDKEISDLTTRKRAPAYSHSLRRNGTILWSVGESLDNPGPGTYSPQTTFVQPHKPSFTIQGIRREKSHYLGPYASF